MLPAIGYAVKAPLKRGVEVAMRTSNNANPIEDIVYNMHKASPKKHAGVLSYISTGVGYNTYAPEAYTGFQKAAKGNDMIDAYLYNKTINPSYGVKKINVDYGPHENYIRKIYPYKDIPVYENTETLDFFTKKPMQKASNITNKTPWKGANNNLDFGDNGVDAAGHLVQEGTSNGKKVYRAQDIWKFNPNEYKQKWSSYDLDSKAVLGLKILDKLGTPTKQTVEYVPQRSNYVYHTTPKYDYKKAFYKYPQYRKWDSKLQESLKHEWTTDFSGIPGRKIDTIQYHWNKNAVPIGAITGGIGGTIDMYNNMNTFDMANPYYFRQLNQEWGN